MARLIAKLRNFYFSQKFLEEYYLCSVIYNSLTFIVLNYKLQYNYYDTGEKLEIATNTGATNNGYSRLSI